MGIRIIDIAGLGDDAIVVSGHRTTAKPSRKKGKKSSRKASPKKKRKNVKPRKKKAKR
jgi:hypothetical protein